MNPSLSPRGRGAKTWLAAALLAGASLSAQAADFVFSGVTDFGPLLGSSFSGSFSFADPVAGFEGPVALSAFSLSFAGQSYSLASADASTSPSAYFVAGSLTGVDYQDSSASDPAVRPHVYLVAGFFDASEAFLGYDVGGDAGLGFGSLSISAVPEPASHALLLAGLGLVGMAAARRRS